MLTKLNRTPEKFALFAVLAGTLAVLSAFLIDLGLSYRDELARGEQELMELLRRARASHDAAIDRGEADPVGPSKLLPPRS